MTDNPRSDLERLSAYVAGDLDADDDARLAARLEREPELRAALRRVEATQASLDALDAPRPSPEFSARLRHRLDDELGRGAGAEEAGRPSRDELGARRDRSGGGWRSALRPLKAVGAAAAAILVVGVGAGIVMRGQSGGGDTATTAEIAQDTPTDYVPTVPVASTDNNFDDLELRRLAVNVDTEAIVPPDLRREGAAELETELVPQLTDQPLNRPFESNEGGDALDEDAGAAGAGSAAGPDATGGRVTSTPQPAAPQAPAEAPQRDAVGRCLPTILDATDKPLVPVYVELADYQDQPAVIYTFAAEEPDTGDWDRIEVWALSPDDCQVLQFTQYTR